MKGYIQQAGPSKWRITYDLPRSTDGLRRQKRETVTGPKRKAQARLAEIQHTLCTGRYVEPTGLTVRDWLESWLARYARVKLSARSYEMHCVNLRKHVIPVIGHIPLHRLETEHLQGLYADLLKVLAPTTVARIRSVVADALNQAVDGKKIVSNPNSRVKLPENLKTTRTKPMVVYTEQQVSTLLKVVRASPLSIEVLLGVATGMRLGEVLAVKWAAINWEARTIRVQEALEYSQEHGIRTKAPKTRSGFRTIPLPPFAVEPLRQHQVRQVEYRTERGGAWNPLGLVCPRRDGEPQLVATVSRAFDRIMQRVSAETGLPDITYHQLRHTYASLLLHQGTRITEVSRLLGHANTVITLEIYGHLIPGADAEAVARYDEHLRRAMQR